jgi:Ca-activated chloride channel family protein
LKEEENEMKTAIQKNKTLPLLSVLCAGTILFTTACAMDAGVGGDESLSRAPGQDGSGGGVGVGQAGAQDFGLFRQILEDGEVPGPDTLDAMGFFAEHKFDYPEPTCDSEACLHGLLGMRGNMITGNQCTLLQLGMNTPLNVSELPRPPLDLALAIDVSGSMGGASIEAVRTGLHRMLDVLEEGDRISVVGYNQEARLLASALDPVTQRQSLELLIDALAAGGGTNIYDGLFLALSEVEAMQVSAEGARQSRAILLSDGVANEGITEAVRFSSLAEGYAKLGVGITAIGVGTDFDVSLMRAISDVGAGNFYFLEDPLAVEEVFAEEALTFLVPLALDVEISVDVTGDFLLRQAYGTRDWEASNESGKIRIPALFAAGRKSADDPIEGGRRGGGGAILVELMQKTDRNDPDAVATLSMTYTDPLTGEPMVQTHTVENPLSDGSAFPEADGFFTDDTVEKGFVTLNVFAAFDIATSMFADGDVATALGTLEAIIPEVEAWLVDHPDPDIEDDLIYLDLFVENLQAFATEPSTPQEPWPMGD